MKKHLQKLSFLFLAAFIFALVQSQNVSAQLSGSGSSRSSGLSGSVSSKLKGKVGGELFKKLSKKRPKKRTRRKKATRKSNARKSTRKSTRKNTVKTPANDPNQDYEEDDYTFTGSTKSLTYSPVGNLYTAEKLAREFSNDPAEQQTLLQVFRVTKTAYDEEAIALGRKDNVAMAMTFFFATCVTVYNDAPEPTDAALETLYQAFAEIISEDATFARASDRDKQEISEILIYISGLVIGGYMNGKETGDQDTVLIFRQLAGLAMVSLTQIDPGKMRFDQNGLVINP